MNKFNLWLMVTLILMSHVSLPHDMNNLYLNDSDVAEDGCFVSSSDDVSYTYFNLTAGMFKIDKRVELPSITQKISIHCNKKMPIEFIVHDRGDFTARDSFSLGKVNKTGNIGYFQIKLSNFTIDNEPAMINYVNGGVNQVYTEKIIEKDEIVGWLNKNKINSGQVFSMDITVISTLNNLTETNGPIIDGAELDGLAEIQLSLGI